MKIPPEWNMNETGAGLEGLVRAALREGAAQQEYWDQHQPELQRHYPDQFVAVLGGEVVATGKNLPELIAALEHADLDARRTWLRFVEATPRTLIL
jgi:hypothetical protein